MHSRSCHRAVTDLSENCDLFPGIHYPFFSTLTAYHLHVHSWLNHIIMDIPIFMTHQGDFSIGRGSFVPHPGGRVPRQRPGLGLAGCGPELERTGRFAQRLEIMVYLRVPKRKLVQ